MHINGSPDQKTDPSQDLHGYGELSISTLEDNVEICGTWAHGVVFSCCFHASFTGQERGWAIGVWNLKSRTIMNANLQPYVPHKDKQTKTLSDFHAVFLSTFLFGAHYKAVDLWNESIAVTLELPGEGVPRDLDSLFEAMDLNRDGSWVKSDIKHTSTHPRK